MILTPYFGTTHVGSVPHVDPDPLCEWLIAALDIPAWPQLPRRTFRENMYVQFSASLPALVLDQANEKIMFDTDADLTSALEAFYERYLAQDVQSFELRAEYASGFFAMLEALKTAPGDWAKGQVTGPISFGLTVTDQNLRASLYHDLLADVIVKNVAMNARWQVQQLSAVRPNVVIFVDEPYMASFGSAYISLSRQQVSAMLDEVFAAIHEAGGLAGVHCCANTDWSVLLETQVDILNLDAYGYLETLALYPSELRAFLDRSGIIAWGIVPNNETILDLAPEQIARHLCAGLEMISDKARTRGIDLPVAALAARSLITPSCGLGSSTPEIAQQALNALGLVADLLRRWKLE